MTPFKLKFEDLDYSWRAVWSHFKLICLRLNAAALLWNSRNVLRYIQTQSDWSQVKQIVQSKTEWRHENVVVLEKKFELRIFYIYDIKVTTRIRNDL